MTRGALQTAHGAVPDVNAVRSGYQGVAMAARNLSAIALRCSSAPADDLLRAEYAMAQRDMLVALEAMELTIEKAQKG